MLKTFSSFSSFASTSTSTFIPFPHITTQLGNAKCSYISTIHNEMLKLNEAFFLSVSISPLSTCVLHNQGMDMGNERT